MALGSSGQNYYYFRYAEVLLNFAEAQNEAAGPDPSVYDAQRRVELAFEGKRWWVLIRWNIAYINLNRQFDATKNYLFPIPQTAIDQNKKLTQNPNY
jgi:hypothetical protein